MLYGKTMKEICAKLGVDRNELPDRLYSTLLGAIKDRVSSVTDKAVSGDIARMDDVSPVEQSVSVKVKSKNRFNYNAWKGVGVTNGTVDFAEDGTVTLTATADDCYTFYMNEPEERRIPVKAGSTITLSWETDAVETGVIGLVYVFAFGKDRIYENKVASAKTLTWVVPDGTEYVTFRLGVKTAGNTIKYWNIQLEEGDTATEYTPYVDVSTVKVTRCGKNLASNIVDSWEQAYYNLSIVDNVMKGKNSNGASNYMYNSAKFLAGKYIVSAEFQGMARYLAKLYGADGRILTDSDISGFGAYNSYYKGFFFPNAVQEINIPDNVAYWQFGIVFTSNDAGLVDKDITITNLQLELGETATDFEAYKGETYTPNADGTVDGVTTVSPTMTIFTDTDGVTLDVEYTRDFETVKGSVE